MKLFVYICMGIWRLVVIKTKRIKKNMDHEHTVEMLKSFGIIEDNESISDYLINNEIEELKIDVDKYIENQNERIKEFAIIILLFGFSESYHSEITNSVNVEVKFKGKILREYIDEKIIFFASSKVLLFFKWDIDRRIFGKNKGNYKLAYLKKIVTNLSDELEGYSDDFLEKYLLLLINFIEDYFKKILSQPGVIKEITKYKILKERSPFEIFDLLENFKEAFSGGIDPEIKNKVFEKYRPLAENYLEGLMNTEGRYNNLYLSFIKAQFEYRSYLEKIIDSFQNINDLKLIKIRSLLEEGEINKFILELKALFASVPNVLLKNVTESYFHIFIHLVLKIIGMGVESEINTNLGRIDAVLKTSSEITVIEFKMVGNNDAIGQIWEKKYYQKYLSDERPINLLGVTFSKTEKNIVDYDFEKDIEKK